MPSLEAVAVRARAAASASAYLHVLTVPRRLKPKYRLRARALRQVVREAESLGYIVLRK